MALHIRSIRTAVTFIFLRPHNGIVEIPPISNSDFNVAGTITAGISGNMINELDALGPEALIFVYFEPIEDASKEEVLTTARGIHIGDSKDMVLSAYGVGFEEPLDMYNDSFYLVMDTDLQAMMRAQCASYVSYYDANGYGIHFYFDDDDEVSWVFFSN